MVRADWMEWGQIGLPKRKRASDPDKIRNDIA